MAAHLAGWRRVTRQVWVCTWWTGRTACLFRTVPVTLTGAANPRADGISSCCYLVNVHNPPSWATHVMKAWSGILVDPCLLSGLDHWEVFPVISYSSRLETEQLWMNVLDSFPWFSSILPLSRDCTHIIPDRKDLRSEWQNGIYSFFCMHRPNNYVSLLVIETVGQLKPKNQIRPSFLLLFLEG